jgi:gentisate 1,2-dioxygenase
VTLVPAAATPRHEHDLTDLMHYHDFSELVIITTGAGFQIINGTEYPVSGGDIFLLQGFSEHAFRGREKLSLINIQFAPSLLPMPLAFLRKIPGYNVMFQWSLFLRNLGISSTAAP